MAVYSVATTARHWRDRAEERKMLSEERKTLFWGRMVGWSFFVPVLGYFLWHAQVSKNPELAKRIRSAAIAGAIVEVVILGGFGIYHLATQSLPKEPPSGYVAPARSGTWGTCDWDINDGTLTVRAGTGQNTKGECPWAKQALGIVTINFEEGAVLPADCSGLFSGLDNTETINMHGADASAVHNMSGMFRYCRNLSTLDATGWNTSHVEDMSFAFGGCFSLHELNLSDWDTSSVSSIRGMFENCEELESVDVSTWDTSRVTNMSEAFYNCRKLETIDLATWDTSHVTDMGALFSECRELRTVDVSHWDVSSVEDMDHLFHECRNLRQVDVSGWKTDSLTTVVHLFGNCEHLLSIDLTSWNMQNITSGNSMFFCNRSLQSIAVGEKCNFTNSSFPSNYVIDGDSSMWFSNEDRTWYSCSQIIESRAGIADTYTAVEV